MNGRAKDVLTGAAAGALLALAAGSGGTLAAAEVRDVLGSAHAGGLYNFTAEDYLDEGGDQLLLFGTRVIKVWLTHDVAALYRFNSSWSPPASGVVALAQKPYFQTLFAKPFTTYLLVIEPVTIEPLFLGGITPAQAAAETAQMHDLASYLLTTYAGSGKTFVLQNWEGDNLLRQGLAAGQVPDGVRLKGMIAWLNARQAGVEQARAEVGEHGVQVVNGVEVNQLADAMAGRVTVTNSVVPFTRADLYSYSSWDIGFDPMQLTRALDYLASKAPPSALFGAHNIYLGEFGAAKDQVPAGEARRSLIDELAETALAWGVRWAVYWQVYDNEVFPSVPAFNPLLERPTADELRGFWLIRPDGVRAAWWSDLERRLGGAEWHLALRSPAGQYLSAPHGEGGLLHVGTETAGPWETFNAVIRGGSGGSGGSGSGRYGRGDAAPSLADGSVVALQTHGGRYVAAVAGSGDLAAGAQAPPEVAGPPAGWVLHRVAGSGPVAGGDEVTLSSPAGRPLAIDPATGTLFVTGPGRSGTPAVFTVEPQDGPPLPSTTPTTPMTSTTPTTPTTPTTLAMPARE